MNLSSISHVFGEHRYCNAFKYCIKEAKKNNYMCDLGIFKLDENINDACRFPAGHFRILLENIYTNLVEQFSVIITSLRKI